MATFSVIAGTTTAISFQLLESGAAIDLTDCTVALMLSDKSGATIADPGTITVTDDATGKVQLVPTDGSVFTVANGPYSARWRITDDSDDISYAPSGSRDVWEIIEA